MCNFSSVAGASVVRLGDSCCESSEDEESGNERGDEAREHFQCAEGTV